jgi:hypothetical protein
MLLHFVDEKNSESAFCFLISPIRYSSLSLAENGGKTDDEKDFRRFGITLVENDHAEKLFNDAAELSRKPSDVHKRKIAVIMGNRQVIVSLERKLLYTDPVHFLKFEKVAS